MGERRTTDFVVGTYSEAEIKNSGFMLMEEKRAHEQLQFLGHEYIYTKPDSFIYGEYVRVFRVYKSN